MAHGGAKRGAQRKGRMPGAASMPQPGMRNVIMATCNRGNEARCTSELGQLLDMALENASSDEDSSQDEAAPDAGAKEVGASFSDLVAQEVAGLRDRGTRDHYALSVDELRCIVLVRVARPRSATRLVTRLFDEIVPAARFCQRVIPLQRIVRADIGEVRREAAALLKSSLPAGQERRRFAVVFESRLNDTLDRATVTEMLAELVGSAHVVDLRAPDIVVMVQVFKALCGLSVIPSYTAWSRYNLQSHYAKRHASEA